MKNPESMPIPGAKFGVNFETMTGYGDAPISLVEFEAGDGLDGNPGDVPMTEAVLETETNAQSDQIFAITGIRPDSRYRVPKSETLTMIEGVQAKDPVAAERLIAAKLPYVYRHIMQSEEATSRDDLTLSDVLGMACLAIIDAGISVGENKKHTHRLAWNSAKILDKFLADSKLASSEDYSVEVTSEEEELAEVAAASGSEVEDAVISQGIRERLLGDLTWRQRYVLERGFGLDDTPDRYMDEIGAELGVTRARIHRIENEALRKIRLQHGNVSPAPGVTRKQKFYDIWLPEH